MHPAAPPRGAQLRGLVTTPRYASPLSSDLVRRVHGWHAIRRHAGKQADIETAVWAASHARHATPFHLPTATIREVMEHHRNRTRLCADG